MRVIRAALEEVCASAVSDAGDLLCCPITHVSGFSRCVHTKVLAFMVAVCLTRNCYAVCPFMVSRK